MNIKKYLSQHFLTTVACSAVLITGVVNPALAVIQNFVGNKSNNGLLLAQAVNLTGEWRGDDGKIYYVRQVGNEFWWYGEINNGTINSSNVFRGNINGDRIVGNWKDVLQGQVRQQDELTLKVESNNKLVRETGNFRVEEWSR